MEHINNVLQLYSLLYIHLIYMYTAHSEFIII